jgi:hypothetical protein
MTQFGVNGGKVIKERKKLKIITNRAAMMYATVAHPFCLFIRGKAWTLICIHIT